VQVPPRPAHVPGAAAPAGAATNSALKQAQPVSSSLAKTAELARPAKKPANAGHMAILDTGSMVSLAQHTESRVRS
ncbi:MAG: hypothetical protein M3127_05420, partial [Actinomycetota bacterium]|nr:hypothetical protein [Actinomycetota bacterium]